MHEAAAAKKKPFLKRGSRKEPSALHRINKNKEKGIVSPPQLSTSYSSSPTSSNISGSGGGLTKKEWDASWATSSSPASASLQSDIPVQVYSKFDSTSSAMHADPGNLGKVRNSDEFAGVPGNLGKVRNSNEFDNVKTTNEYSISNTCEI